MDPSAASSAADDVDVPMSVQIAEMRKQRGLKVRKGKKDTKVKAGGVSNKVKKAKRGSKAGKPNPFKVLTSASRVKRDSAGQSMAAKVLAADEDSDEQDEPPRGHRTSPGRNRSRRAADDEDEWTPEDEDDEQGKEKGGEEEGEGLEGGAASLPPAIVEELCNMVVMGYDCLFWNVADDAKFHLRDMLVMLHGKVFQCTWEGKFNVLKVRVKDSDNTKGRREDIVQALLQMSDEEVRYFDSNRKRCVYKVEVTKATRLECENKAAEMWHGIINPDKLRPSTRSS
ncbi:unnamed protein product [Vitrella brassicaformis CCMP3155]|uniref:Uncharacterized protein n=1 Tax=Vitrella brassicaformis (strain CCMP3155) TaxID=1169540 RepID=A0A0G4FS30_VITBC|nr:unnamed protein product [Vitrella brassicaformis CCMP3155]|mmetsp:Transcript_21914/g.53748  ORF Transcript_21914/g.53748 Transcript_21914/m.53748 type:complete len:284 (-) Transcript_21914:390-1241(-)|eukprot:CEM17484.1 unnamed protein product [Vitrella brassicaformis CCMP3155]